MSIGNLIVPFDISYSKSSFLKAFMPDEVGKLKDEELNKKP